MITISTRNENDLNATLAVAPLANNKSIRGPDKNENPHTRQIMNDNQYIRCDQMQSKAVQMVAYSITFNVVVINVRLHFIRSLMNETNAMENVPRWAEITKVFAESHTQSVRSHQKPM